ncbi:MAG: MotA/TolQ/ExbB proton channel family protein [Rubrivivax sp.]|nr:MotA/TolQ/ExbB proton channel family protein [Rubrivivax sp.]
MSTALETSMYTVAQLFLLPTLLLIAALFLYAFWLLGEFAVLALRRRQGGGRPLVAAHRAAALSEDELDLKAHKLMEGPRIASRVTPLLGLVATMIPMGPALKGLSDGNLAQVSSNLTVAFSAVILALIAAAITFWIANVRRRWLAEEILEIMQGRTAGAAPLPAKAATVAAATAGAA